MLRLACTWRPEHEDSSPMPFEPCCVEVVSELRHRTERQARYGHRLCVVDIACLRLVLIERLCFSYLATASSPLWTSAASMRSGSSV
jgi:hypothetical protein